MAIRKTNNSWFYQNIFRCLLLLWTPQVAFGHAQLLSQAELDALGSNAPIPRVNSDNIKDSQPCGPDGGQQAPLRTYVKGSTIDIHWKETINHTGVFRIDFSTDGDSTFVPLVADINDPNDSGVSRATPKMYTATITLPDVECDNCTLRMTQSMGAIDDNNDYFSCADIRLVATAADLPAEPPETGSGSETTDNSSNNETSDSRELASFESSGVGCGTVGKNSPPPPSSGLLLITLPLTLVFLLRRRKFCIPMSS